MQLFWFCDFVLFLLLLFHYYLVIFQTIYGIWKNQRILHAHVQILKNFKEVLAKD